MPAKRKKAAKKTAKTIAKPKRSAALQSAEALLIVPAGGAELGPAQAEFNKFMKRLAGERRKLERHRERLDRDLELVHRELMPVLENIHRADRDFVFAGAEALEEIKLSKKRRDLFGDLLAEMAVDLIDDSAGLPTEDLEKLETIFKTHDRQAAERAEAAADDLDLLRAMFARATKNAGVDMDLADIDLAGDPGEIQRQLLEKIQAFQQAAGGAEPKPRARKPTKKQLEKERLQRELDEAKTRDIKSLYKQLAKALHPDLEPDPTLRAHKEIWMKRLTTAYAGGDLRDMLEIEMEWLGEESGNLTQASDTKLRAYCMVLKEQIATFGRRIAELAFEPQYRPLSRFTNRFTGRLEDPDSVKREMQQFLRTRRGFALELTAPAPGPKRTIEAWADKRVRPPQRDIFHF